MTITDPIRYSSKIIKAGALLADTKMMLAAWDATQTVPANLERFRRENIFGKASRSRIEDILAIFRQRYLDDPALLPALLVFAQTPLPALAFDRILYYLALRADALLHDAVTEVLLPTYARGQQEVTVEAMSDWVLRQVAAGRTERPWSEVTVARVAQGLMATLRDFGVLQGIKTKRIAPVYLPVTAFSFLALVRYRELGSGERVLHDPEWQLFFLPGLAVERSFVEAHQERLLEYYAAGPVIRLTFPTESLEEYAYALAQRAY